MKDCLPHSPLCVMSSRDILSIIVPGQGVTEAPMAGVVCNVKILTQFT